jgi:hypothetical protein
MRLTCVLIAVTALAGCASGPSKPVSDPPSVPTVAAPVAPVAPAIANDAAAKADPESAASREFLPPPGYQKKTRGTKTLYCRSDTPVGTRFATEYCYTQSDLERMDASRTSIRQEVDRARRTCVGTGCGGG